MLPCRELKGSVKERICHIRLMFTLGTYSNGGFLPIGLFGGGGELRDEERDSSKAPTASSGDPTSGASAMSEDGSISPTVEDATSYNVKNEEVWSEDPFEEQGQNSEGFFKGWGDDGGGGSNGWSGGGGDGWSSGGWDS